MSSNLGGYAYFPNGSCGDHVTSNIQVARTYRLHNVTGLRTHEHGHNLRLEHEFHGTNYKSIMSYDSDPVEFQGYRPGPKNEIWFYPRDESWPELTSMYGGEAAKPIETEIPPPPPPPGTTASLRGGLERYVGDSPTGEKYLVVPY